MGTVIVGVVLAGIVALSIRSMIRDKRSGKSLQCGGDCSKCRGCH
ncbi:MAG: FeoB-associated Cys-rich membrane protein [Lachnospiraceae bacterium]|nr:FeoB-associated Cys-rich membrane protein [Lachnospiraceae bacterium]